MGTAAAPEGSPAQRTEAGLIPGKTRLRFPDVRHGVAAQPESVVGAGFAGRLGRGRADRQSAGGGQQAERNDGREPDKYTLNMLHLRNPRVMPMRLPSPAT
jgi:hypothetical protein